jgi:hypothetical protein
MSPFLRFFQFRFGPVIVALAVSSPTWAAKPLPGGLPPSDDPIYQLRDPFRRPEITLEKEAPKEPLQLIPVDDLKLVGVTLGLGRVVAMLKDKGGKTWYVREGMKIGTQGGVIVKITATQVQIKETTQNALGQEEVNDKPIYLPNDRVNPLLEDGAAVERN